MVSGVLRRYAAFGGRATRAEFWGFALASVIVFVVIGFLAGFGAALSPGEAPIKRCRWLCMGLAWLFRAWRLWQGGFMTPGFRGVWGWRCWFR